jgi:AcrR family transcriptional regulator
VIQEMVACVVEEGFTAASARRVTERAGVTWGVVQYHFGDRDGILAAVIEQGYAELLAALASLVPVEPAARLTRSQAEQIVDLAWQAFSTDLSRAAFEILVATREDRDPRIQLRLREVAREVHSLGARLTGDAAVGEALWAALRGMVLTRMMTGATLDTSAERQALVALIAHHTKPQ